MLLHKSFNDKALKGENCDRLKKANSKSDEKIIHFSTEIKMI